jgi:hypothetical protein
MAAPKASLALVAKLTTKVAAADWAAVSRQPVEALPHQD